MSSPPEDWRVSFRGRAFLPPYLRLESIRRTGFPLTALALDFAKLPITLRFAFFARTFEVRECAEIATPSYLGAANLLHLDFEDTHPRPSVWRLLEIGGEEYRR